VRRRLLRYVHTSTHCVCMYSITYSIDTVIFSTARISLSQSGTWSILCTDAWANRCLHIWGVAREHAKFHGRDHTRPKYEATMSGRYCEQDFWRTRKLGVTVASEREFLNYVPKLFRLVSLKVLTFAPG